MRRAPSTVTVDWAREEPEERSRMDEEIRRVARELSARGASLVVLFGSRARGEERAGSDADMLAVMPRPEGERSLAFLADLYAAIAPRRIDLLVYTPDELREMRITSPLVRDALAEGKVLHGG